MADLKGGETVTLTCRKTVARNHLFIDEAAIRANIDTFQTRTGGSIMAIIKANSYGVGSEVVAPILESSGASMVGLQEVKEALVVRESGCSLPILLLSYTGEEIEAVVEGGFAVAVSQPPLIDRLQKEAKRQGRILSVHLDLDTGLNRLGCQLKESLAIALQVARSPNLRLDGIMSHFSSADDPSQDDWTRIQAGRFFAARRELQAYGMAPRWSHIGNTAGSGRFLWPECNLARIGLGLYGLTSTRPVAEAISLEPALSLESQWVEIRHCDAGETVGYGATHTLKEATRIGVVPIGYGDGIHMHHSNCGEVWSGGKRLPIVGLICMDFLMVDLSSLPTAQIGDRVVLFGKELPAHEVASRVGTTVHQLITCLGSRIKREVRF